MKTQVFLTRSRRGFKLNKNPFPGASPYYAIWKVATVGLWKRIEHRDNPAETEKLIWYYLLQDTNLVPCSHEENHLSKATMEGILKTVPASLPSSLVSQFHKSIYLNSQEVLQIERQSYQLWGSSNSSVRNPHPLLEEVVGAMGLYEKLGLQVYPNLDDIPVKTFHAIKQILANYSQAMAMNEQQRHLRQSAIEQAGIGQHVTRQTKVH